MSVRESSAPAQPLNGATGIAGSAAFSSYLYHFSSYPGCYGAMAAFMILLTWIYLISFVLAIGAKSAGVFENLERRRAAA